MDAVYNQLAIDLTVRYNPEMDKADEQIWHLYILMCRDRSLYTGVTTDVERRLHMHQKGAASKFTRSRLPVKLKHQEACKSRADALRKEYAIKKMSRQDKVKYIRKPWTIEQ